MPDRSGLIPYAPGPRRFPAEHSRDAGATTLADLAASNQIAGSSGNGRGFERRCVLFSTVATPELTVANAASCS